MFKLFLGSALALLTFDITMKGQPNVIGLFPHFIGYLLIYVGAKELEPKSNHFQRVYLPTCIMTGYAFVAYVLKAMGLFAKIEDWNAYVAYIIDVLEAVGSVIVMFFVIFGITNVEHKRRADYGCARLQLFWKIMSVGFLLFYICNMTMLVQTKEAAIFFVGIATMGFNMLKSLGIVLFLFMFYRTWTKYEEKISSR